MECVSVTEGQIQNGAEASGSGKPRRNADLPVADWLSGARERAAKRIEKSGLPSRRDEYWKYTDPGALTAGSGSRAGSTPISVQELLRDDAAWVSFDNGILTGITAAAPDAPELTSFASASIDNGHWASEYYGAIEASAQRPTVRGFATDNTRRAGDGIFVRTVQDTDHSLQLSYKSTPGSSAVLHHVVCLEPGSELNLLEVGSVAELANVVIEVEVKDGARLNLMRIQDRSWGPRSVDQVFARVGPGGTFNLFTLSAHHEFVRNECSVELKGEGGTARLSGAVVGGRGSHHDDTVLINHKAANCESRQVFKKVLFDDAVGVFQGKIHVTEGAQKTDGYQISKGMLLGTNSQFLAKPELEIYADDVVCSHGSTSGSVNPEDLFYLRARGIQKNEAVNLLAQAFLSETLEEISDTASVKLLQGLIASYLAEQNNAGRH